MPTSTDVPPSSAYAGEAGTEIVEQPGNPRHENLPRRIGRVFDALLGFLTLVPFLAVISAVPLLNLFSLGYLLESSARVARSGRLRDGFIGYRGFSAIGKALLCLWIAWLPLRIVYSYWQDAELITPGSPNSRALRLALIVLSLLFFIHVTWALIRGGKLRHFLWPAPFRLLRWLGSDWNVGPVIERLRSYVKALRLGHFFRLGAGGFAGAAMWLALPVLVLFASAQVPQPGLSFLGSFLGSVLLGLVVMYLPFLQTRYAITTRFRAFREFRSAREAFRRAPLAFWTALSATLLFALPLYLLKIELTPDEIAWLPNIVFVLFIFPARLLLGWAMARADRRESARSWVWRWLARLGALPVVAIYVFIVWLSQYLSWHGSFGLAEQHAFLVPAPLLGL